MRASPCQVNQSIERALADGAASYAARRITLSTDLACEQRLTSIDPVLDSSLYTIFRGLPARLTDDAVLRIVTRDRAGGDIELTWEADEKEPVADEGHPLAQDAAYGDLLELAIAGLETFCRARSGHMEVGERTLRRAPGVRRRYFFLIPSLRRDTIRYTPGSP